MEVEVPPVGSRVSLVRASTNSLEVCWVATPTAQAYVLEVQKIESPLPAQPTPSTIFTKKIQNVNSQVISVVGNDAVVKDPILTSKPQTPTAIRLTSPPSAVASTPISFAVATSPISSVAATSVALSQTGQPIIISSAPQVSTPLQSKPIIKGVVSSPSIQQQQQSVRLVNTSTSNVRVISGGQTVRLTQGGAVGQPLNTTILRQQPTIITTPTTSGNVSVSDVSVSAATAIGAKQIFVQKPINLASQNVLQLVKTSQGLTVQSLPKLNVAQKTGTSVGGTIQQIPAGSQIVSTGVNNQGKTALIGTNVVKLMAPSGVGGNKILMKNSNLVQVGKMSTAAGKPAFVFTNKQGQSIRTNQQFIFVTTAGGIRTVQTGAVTATSSGNTFVSLVSSPQINTVSSVIAGTANAGTPTGAMKMIRGVGQQGKPITFTLPVSNLQGNKSGSPQIISMPQKAMIGGKAVTVQIAPGNQKTVTIVSSASGGIQKTINASDLQASGHKIVMMPSKRVANISNVLTHKTVQLATHVGGADECVDASQEGTILEHLETIDQMDGAFDCDGILDEPSVETKKKALLKVAISRETRAKFNRSMKKNVPRYVRMGLFGGNPPDDEEPEPESLTEAVETSDHVEQTEEDVKIKESVEEAAQAEAASEDQQIDEDAVQDEEQPAESTDTADTDAIMGDAVEDSTKVEPIEPAIKEEQQIAVTVATTKSEDDTVLPTEEPLLKLETRSTAEPTPSETEAANILTTIKSGELLRNTDSKSENILITTTASGASKVSTSSTEDAVKILFNNEPALIATTKNGGLKSSQKVNVSNTFIAANTEHLDALASAALQASSGKHI